MGNNQISTPVVGIDLGTTFSCVAHYNKGKPDIIADRNGDRLIPSAVYYDPNSGDVYVGKIVYDLSPICPGNALRDIKRVIGRRYDDEFLIKYRNLKQTHFSIVKGENDLAAFEVEIKRKKVLKTPEEVSSEILKYLKIAASTYLGQEVTEAVVSVPAYFSNSQKKATKKAAELAGLKVLKLITEPVAGAIHYSRNRNINANIAVVDWGGGTLDVSFIKVNEQTFTVKAVGGDTLLGGRNIDEILYDNFYIPVTNFPIKFSQRLLQECIILKQHLSVTSEITKIMHCADGLKDLELHITRKKFEELTQPIFDRFMTIVERGLSGTGWKKSEITEVILVGGSTRIPKVSQLLEEYFGKNKIKTDLNPDEAVAGGACIQAGLLKYNPDDLLRYRITEVTPLTLGKPTADNIFMPIIEKNSPLPAYGERIFTNAYNYQATATIDIYEGERKICTENNKLVEFRLFNLPLRRAGDVSILIKLKLDEDGILTVTANEVNSSKSQSLEFAMGEFWLSGRNVHVSIVDAQTHKEEDDAFEQFTWRKSELKLKCRRILFDLNKITIEDERNLVKTKCEEFITNADQMHHSNLEGLNASFNIMYESIVHILRKCNKGYFNFFYK